MIEISERIRTQMGIGEEPEVDLTAPAEAAAADPDDLPITLDD